MKADLDYIQQQTEKALITTNSNKKENVLGFLIPSNNNALAIAQVKQKSEEYNTDRHSLQLMLDKIDVKPLAFIPSNYWKEICKATSLYQLRPDGAGNVYIDSAPFVGIEVKARKITNRLSLAAAGALGLVSLFLMNQISYVDTISAILAPLSVMAVTSILSFLALKLLGIALNDNKEFNGPRDYVEIFLAWKFTKHSNEWQAKQLLSRVNSNGRCTRIVLPTPDETAINVINKIRSSDLRLEVAAPGKAIAFPNIRLNFDDYLKKRKDERIQSYKDWKNDPIGYVTYKSAVAIVFQYGDFPIEKEVVDFVVNKEM